METAPLAAAHTASLFCESLPIETGMELAPDFVREYDRVAAADND